MANTVIGRVLATEKNPTTIDDFTFWTDPELILNPFDIVKVQHVNNSYSYGVIEDIAHITDAASFLTNFISSDFGDVNSEENTLRVGMNYVTAKVVCNTENIYIPLQSNAKVMLATVEEIKYALGLNDIRNPLVCGYLEMYEGTKDCEKVTLPVNLNSKFIIGPEGAHLNISGISGLASKTSYAMFLLKAIQDSYMKKDPQNEDEDSVAFVLFNVKGKDLLAIDQLNDFSDERNPEQARKDTFAKYEKLGLAAEPFKNVQYYYPYSIPKTRHWNTYMTPEENSEHYFEVEMFDINKENTDLLNETKVREYLSFVVPVPYRNTFILRNHIYTYAKSIGYTIDEYCVRVNGSQIFKEYTTRLKEQSGSSLKNYDEISRLEFKDFRDANGNLIAWMWVGLSRFEKQIPSINHMRGLRVRSANIQLGNDDALQPLFKENRGNYYFVGEVFAASRNLIPNSQRDYFNENETRVLFEDLLREYFYDVLHKLYYEANRVKNDYKRQEEYLNKVAEYQRKEKEQGFVNEEERQKLQFDIDKAKKSAEDARKRLDKLDTSDSTSPLSEVRKSIGQKYEADKLKKKAEVTTVAVNDDDKKK